MTGRFTRPLFWFALALPALLMLSDLARGAVLAMDLLHPSGELSVRLVIAAMLAGPLAGVFGPSRFFRGWLAIRRNLGVAAFGYAMLHLIFYFVDMGAIAVILDELALPSIWTGWLALALMAVPAAISFDQAMRKMGRHKWKTAQRLVYPCLLLSLVHWLLLDWKWQPAAVHLAPLAMAWAALLVVRHRTRISERNPAA
ncbi:MAG: protein-methionine-sulfoxide reductase heme-binding subunit MsrQ [Pseudomonadota bacterium]|jgi:sulfoxide reductase heme-binding subunit YedZ|nr:ferric reductase-like transmembrane domain-containing protein [Novosphingobium sp.]